MFDQVDPTLLIYTVWSAIDLVPSWTKKIKPRASDNKPINRRTKRIMTFYAWRNMHRPSIDYPARPVRSIDSDNLPLGMSGSRRRHGGAGGAGRRMRGACLERWAFDPLPLALRPFATGYIRG